MKKIFLFIALGAALASCRKDRTCTCTETSDSPGYESSTNVTVYYDSKKRDARISCQSYTEKYTGTGASGYIYTTTCVLK